MSDSIRELAHRMRAPMDDAVMQFGQILAAFRFRSAALGKVTAPLFEGPLHAIRLRRSQPVCARSPRSVSASRRFLARAAGPRSGLRVRARGLRWLGEVLRARRGDSR